MPIKITNTYLDGLFIIEPEFFNDERGSFYESFNFQDFSNLTTENFSFVLDCHSHSKKNVLRGLHIQLKNSQAKIITVTHGKIFDVAVDLRKKSKTFGKYVGLTISQNDDFSFYIPEGFAHGFLCLSKKCTVLYKCSEYRHKASEKTLKWNDETVGVKWPLQKPILSKKDKIGKDLKFFR